MTEDENDRGKILSLARMVAGVGGIGVLVVQIAQALGTAFVNKIDKNAADYDTLVQRQTKGLYRNSNYYDCYCVCSF